MRLTSRGSLSQRFAERRLGGGGWVIDAGDFGERGGDRGGADLGAELAIFHAAAEEEQGHVGVVMPGAAVGRAVYSQSRRRIVIIP